MLAAQAAANKAATPAADGSLPDALTQQTIKLEEFATSGFDRADYSIFENRFQEQLEMIINWSKQDSPATKAAKLVAAKQGN